MDSILLAFTVFLVIYCATNVLSQSISCSGFEINTEWTELNSTIWTLSNDESPTHIADHDSGFIWSTYDNVFGKPIIASPVMSGITASTTFSLQFSMANSKRTTYISFRRLSSRITVPIAAPTAKDDYAWTSYSGSCSPQPGISCCGSDSESCSGQFIIEGGQIYGGEELAFDTFSTNGGLCADIQNPECSTFDDWGDWSRENGWVLSKTHVPDRVIPIKDTNYVWSDYTKNDAINPIPVLRSPIIGVTSSTTYSFEYYMPVGSGNFSLLFQKQSTKSALNITLEYEILNLNEAWELFSGYCNGTYSEDYCCGAERETCYGQFLIVGDGFNSDSVLAIDNFSINEACGSPTIKTTAETTANPGTTVTTTVTAKTNMGTALVPEAVISLTLVMALTLWVISA